ncbi:hypothetical protein ZHAS_00005861 [Anopheles sinensis]|uniref:Fibrinogen C-terminal domain-containing protein n=1 Tax=Anopheles sinensis TaxID=74873 RepID=A0A084VKG6_ANOSI|nr:hypothetical protein ZHAS_00005861 [Anopheles sinensis]
MNEVTNSLEIPIEENKQDLKERHLNLQNKLFKLEKDVMEQIDKVDSKIDAKVLAMDFVKKNCSEYRKQYGNVNGEFSLGLEYEHQFIKNRRYELIVEIRDFQGNYGNAKDGELAFGSESEKYKLKKR